MNPDKCLYVLDTNSIIDLHRRLRPEDKPPDVLEKIEDAIAQGDIFLADEVIDELSEMEDEIYKWTKKQSSKDPKRNYRLKMYQEKVQELVDKYSESYPQIARDGGADLHIIAWGKILNATVITEEKLKSEKKIPNVCEKEEVKCKNILEMFEDYGWYP